LGERYSSHYKGETIFRVQTSVAYRIDPGVTPVASAANAPADSHKIVKSVPNEILITDRLLKRVVRLRDQVAIARRFGIPMPFRRARWNAAIRALDARWSGGYVKAVSGDFVYLPAPLDYQAKRFLKGEDQIPSPVLRHLPKGGVAFDVGANLGEWTLAMAHATGASGQVLAFEPSRVVADALVRTLEINSLNQVTPYCCALSSKNGMAEFILSTVSNGQSRLGKALPSEGAVSVPTRTLDSVAEQAGITRLDLIKIDVEGHEHYVLKGAANTLFRFQPAIVFESGHESAGDREAIATLFETAGYTAGAVLVDNGALPITLAEYRDATGACGGAGTQNIFLLPASRRQAL
jgi:FkbM family methyltransferase